MKIFFNEIFNESCSKTLLKLFINKCPKNIHRKNVFCIKWYNVIIATKKKKKVIQWHIFKRELYTYIKLKHNFYFVFKKKTIKESQMCKNNYLLMYVFHLLVGWVVILCKHVFHFLNFDVIKYFLVNRTFI